ncbi:MAG TPA: ABC transporter permease [Terriglobales bacterium]|nr:ABC transporter permease [Terriglobales bacterium]
MQNLRFAFRQLRKAPGFSAVVVITLALGIGATTAIFSLVEGVLLRPLPFRDPERLVILGEHLGTGPNTPVSAREIGMYSEATKAFSAMGGWIGASYELSGGAVPEAVNAARVTAGVFQTLDVQPVLGRVFSKTEEDERQPLTVISYSLWLNRFQRDPNVLGKSIDLDRKAYTIVGVMPRSFEFPLQTGRLNQAQLWVPMSLTPEELSEDNAGFFGFRMVARLKDGVTMAQAAQDADRVAQQIMKGYPASMAQIKIRGDVTPLRESLVSDVRPVLRTLFIAVGVVLLIACVNVAGLLLVRAIRRRREYAVRLALGASAGAIIRESIFEGIALSLTGGLLGLGLASVLIRTALSLLPESMPRIEAIAVDGTVAIFALGVAVVSGSLCSLAPAFAALKTNLTEGLKAGDRTSTGGASHTWLRSALVVAEIGIALVLLTTSGAFLRSFQKMREVDPGFRPENVLVGYYQLPLNQYGTSQAATNFQRAVIDRLSSKPGIMAVGMTDSLPASNGFSRATFTIEGRSVESWKLQFSNFANIYGDYFKTMGIPLREGRAFTLNDNASAPPVVIVNETMAKNWWPGESPIGKRMHVGNPRKPLPWATVVGVVADTKLGARDEPSEDQWYAPALQPQILLGPLAQSPLNNPAGGFISIRSALPPEQMVQTLRAGVREVDPLIALQQVQSMNEVISTVEAPRQFNTDLITGFAMAALLLAITGIYAVVAFSVSLQTREIAIRMALGARTGTIARMVLTSGAKLAFIGCLLGVAGSLAASRMVSSFLFQVSATDPLIYLGGVAIMMAMTLMAVMLPARRAASADPIEALRAI